MHSLLAPQMTTCRMLLAALVTAIASAPPADTLDLLTACPPAHRTCIVMTLDDSARPADTAPPAGDSAGFASIALEVRGQLESQAPATHIVRLRSFTDGVSCGALGQATVAVVGFTAGGDPMLLTSRGTLTVTGGTLKVGCPDCAQLIGDDGQRHGAPIRTPAWDLREVGLSMEQLSYDDEGTLFVRGAEGCVALTRSGAFSAVENDRCVPMNELGRYGRPALGVTLGAGEWIHRAPGRRFAVRVNAGACT